MPGCPDQLAIDLAGPGVVLASQHRTAYALPHHLRMRIRSPTMRLGSVEHGVLGRAGTAPKTIQMYRTSTVWHKLGAVAYKNK